AAADQRGSHPRLRDVRHGWQGALHAGDRDRAAAANAAPGATRRSQPGSFVTPAVDWPARSRCSLLTSGMTFVASTNDLTELDAAAAVVYDAMPATPQQRWPLLDARCGAPVWVKHENHTPVGAFKVRGGLVYFDHL